MGSPVRWPSKGAGWNLTGEPIQPAPLLGHLTGEPIQPAPLLGHLTGEPIQPAVNTVQAPAHVAQTDPYLSHLAT